VNKRRIFFISLFPTVTCLLCFSVAYLYVSKVPDSILAYNTSPNNLKAKSKKPAIPIIYLEPLDVEPVDADQAPLTDQDLEHEISRFYQEVFSKTVCFTKQEETKKSDYLDARKLFQREKKTEETRSADYAYSFIRKPYSPQDCEEGSSGANSAGKTRSNVEISLGGVLTSYDDSSVDEDYVPPNLSGKDRERFLERDFEDLGIEYDRISKEQAFELAKPVLKYYKLPLDSREYNIFVPSDHSEWMILRSFSYKGIKCFGRAIIIKISRYSGLISHIHYAPVVLPKEGNEKISKQDALNIAKKWVASHEQSFFKQFAFRYDGDTNKIEKIIAPPAALSFSKEEKEYIASFTKEGVVRCCWRVRVYAKGDPNKIISSFRVDMETGTVIGIW
jgi:hypothetical protein